MTDELISIWLDSVDRVAEDSYRTLSGRAALPGSVRADSAMWTDRFLSPIANPHLRGADVAWSYHLATKNTPDLVRAAYQIPSLRLEVIESRAYFITRVDGPAPTTREAITAAADLLLAKPSEGARWRFQLPAVLNEGVRFSTNPDVGPSDIDNWPDRVDGGIRRGRLYFLQFKKVLDRQGYPDLRRWFDEPFRSNP